MQRLGAGRKAMGTKDWTAAKLMECLSDNLPLTGEQRSILMTLVVEQDKRNKDADRYHWLRQRLFGADFDWNGEGESVVLFSWPATAPIGADLDAAIDGAMQAGEAVGAA